VSYMRRGDTCGTRVLRQATAALWRPLMPAVLVQGVPDTHRLSNKLRSHLSRRDVLAPSLRRFGVPTPPGFQPTKEIYVEWLIGEIEGVGAPVDLVGHDWGSLLVQRVVSLRPDLIRTWACGDGPFDRAASLASRDDVGDVRLLRVPPYRGTRKRG